MRLNLATIWAGVVFFALPPLLKMAGDSGLFEAVRWLIGSANGS
jgi:hypothetical protein